MPQRCGGPAGATFGGDGAVWAGASLPAMRPLLLLLRRVPVRAAAQREPFVRYGAREGLEDARALAPDGPGALYVATGTGRGALRRRAPERTRAPPRRGRPARRRRSARVGRLRRRGALAHRERRRAALTGACCARARAARPVPRPPPRGRRAPVRGRARSRIVGARSNAPARRRAGPASTPTRSARSPVEPDGTLWATARDGFGVRRPGARAFAWHPAPGEALDAVVAVPGGAWLIADDRRAGAPRRTDVPAACSAPTSWRGGRAYRRPPPAVGYSRRSGPAPPARSASTNSTAPGASCACATNRAASATCSCATSTPTPRVACGSSTQPASRTVLPPGRASTRSTRPRASGNWPANLSRATTQRSGSWRGRAFTSPTRRDVSPASAQPCASSPVASSRTGRARWRQGEQTFRSCGGPATAAPEAVAARLPGERPSRADDP